MPWIAYDSMQREINPSVISHEYFLAKWDGKCHKH